MEEHVGRTHRGLVVVETLAVREIYSMINAYVRRKLIYDSDILNAIVGILTNFNLAKPKIYHLWGVPILHAERDQPTASEAGLKWGLCWNLIEPGQ